jgi:mRNA degradation ribonuclease J1/J2
MKGSQELLKEIENLVFDIHHDWERQSQANKNINIDNFKEAIEKELGKLIYKKTEREPIILTVII